MHLQVTRLAKQNKQAALQERDTHFTFREITVQDYSTSISELKRVRLLLFGIYTIPCAFYLGS